MAQKSSIQLEPFVLFGLHAVAMFGIVFAVDRVSAQTSQSDDTLVSAPPFGTFLESMDGQSRRAPGAPQTNSLSYPLLNGSDAFRVVRFFNGDQLHLKMRYADQAFGLECQAHGGNLRAGDQTRMAFDYFAGGGTGLVSSSATFSYRACFSSVGAPLSGMVQIRTQDAYRRDHLAIYVLTRQATNAVLTAQFDREAREEAFRTAMERRREDNDANWAAWRRALAIGSETNCGPVIDIRGPMIEIGLPASLRNTNGPAEIWLKREQLYPVGAEFYSGGLVRCEGL